MPPNTIRQLYTGFASRTDRMVELYNVTTNLGSKTEPICPQIERDSRLFCVIRLQHLWGEFCRELLVRSSIGGATTIGGLYLPRASGIKRPSDVTRVARRTLKQRHIAWHIPDNIARIANEIAPANENEIIIAVNSVSPVANILAIRNYLVHPNPRTRLAYSNAAIELGMPDSDPDTLLCARISPGGVTRFESWIIQLQAIALSASR